MSCIYKELCFNNVGNAVQRWSLVHVGVFPCFELSKMFLFLCTSRACKPSQRHIIRVKRSLNMIQQHLKKRIQRLSQVSNRVFFYFIPHSFYSFYFTESLLLSSDHASRKQITYDALRTNAPQSIRGVEHNVHNFQLFFCCVFVLSALGELLYQQHALMQR